MSLYTHDIRQNYDVINKKLQAIQILIFANLIWHMTTHMQVIYFIKLSPTKQPIHYQLPYKPLRLVS